MYTCGPAFIGDPTGGAGTPTTPTTDHMDFGFRGQPFVIQSAASDVTLDLAFQGQPFIIQAV